MILPTLRSSLDTGSTFPLLSKVRVSPPLPATTLGWFPAAGADPSGGCDSRSCCARERMVRCCCGASLATATMQAPPTSLSARYPVPPAAFLACSLRARSSAWSATHCVSRFMRSSSGTSPAADAFSARNSVFIWSSTAGPAWLPVSAMRRGMKRRLPLRSVALPRPLTQSLKAFSYSSEPALSMGSSPLATESATAWAKAGKSSER
mmetsp:Transcript_12831/g.25383  ORF Transcript_12831/g.25383 Transcript_12831/m.25383 type:complete len:207 (+) Transcript_12831:727-1347(+)